MAKLRKGISYRRLERPYTRQSKYKRLNFVRSVPHNLIVRYEMGDPRKKFDYLLKLKTKLPIQLRHNAIEAARQSSNRLLEKNLGKNDYYMKINIFPHHILRENPLASGAGADRMSTGMQKSFGKPIGLAAQVKKGQTIFTIAINKQNLELARQAMRRVYTKLPCSCAIVITENK